VIFLHKAAAFKRQFFKKVEKEPLPWFFIISLLIHHAILTLLIHPENPSIRQRHRTKWKVIEISQFKQDTRSDVVLFDQKETKEIDVEREAEKKTILSKKFEEKDKKDEREKKKELEKEVKEEEKIEVEMKNIKGLHYVDIRNNKSEKPPQDARFFAPQNSIVDEETRAQNTNMDRDDGMSNPEQSEIEDENPGNANDEIAAHKIKEDKKIEQEKGNDNREGEKVVPIAMEPSGSKEEAKELKELEKEVLEKKVMVKVEPPLLTPDNAPKIQLEKSENGEILDTETGKPVVSMTEYFKKMVAKNKKKNLISGESSEGKGTSEMDLPWKIMEQGVLAKKMDEEKNAFEQVRKTHNKGGFTKNINKVMAQLENFTPDIKPGNQTALNAAFHPFAEYITAFHRKLHPQWGDGYLVSLMGKPPNHPHNNMNLYAKLEFVINSDGTIDKVTVVQSSGDLAYDVAAIDAVYAGAPYPPPPDIIKSYNGKVYMRWGFYRNESQCGVWNAEPYIIPAPKVPVKKTLAPKELPSE